MLHVSSCYAEQLSLALVGFFFPSGTDHFDQQYGDAAHGASGHCGILTAHTKSFQAGLIFEEVKGAFAIFANFEGLPYLPGFVVGNALEYSTINRDISTLEACD